MLAQPLGRVVGDHDIHLELLGFPGAGIQRLERPFDVLVARDFSDDFTLGNFPLLHELDEIRIVFQGRHRLLGVRVILVGHEQKAGHGKPEEQVGR